MTPEERRAGAALPDTDQCGIDGVGVRSLSHGPATEMKP